MQSRLNGPHSYVNLEVPTEIETERPRFILKLCLVSVALCKQTE
jgi:hypothetical protein